MIDLPPERPSYHDLAAILREQITSGQLQPGDKLPSESTLQQTYGTGRPTVRRAIDQLRNQGLVITRHGFGTYVRGSGTMSTMHIPHGTQVTARMPTPDERKEHRIPDGVPVFVITRPGEPNQVIPADRVTLEVNAPKDTDTTSD